MSKPWEGKAKPLPAQAMEDAAREIGADTAAIRAVWEVEAAGKYFLSDGTVIRRFEPHHMPGSSMNWRDSLKIGRKRREEMFLKAYRDSPDAALRATSWGAAQIMGFNAGKCGFSSAEEMVVTMARGAQDQLDAFVALVNAWDIDGAIRSHDWEAFARRWNGSGQVQEYARRMESAYRRHSGGARSPQVLRVGSSGKAVKRLQEALGIDADGEFGPRTLEAVEEFQAEADLTVDGVVGKKTWAALESARGAKPERQKSKTEDVAERVSKISATVGTASGAAAGVNEVVPPDALTTIYIVAAVTIAAAALIYAWRRLA